jgi:glyoxylate reductase
MSEARVLLTRRMPPPAAGILNSAGIEVLEIEQDEPVEREVLLERIAGMSGVVTMLSDRVDHAFLEAAGSNLRVIANYAVGTDNIDLDACRVRNVVVTNTPGVLTDATADLAMALLLATARRLRDGDLFVRAGQWQGWAPLQLLGLQLSGATLGIVGAGRIGTAVARRAAAFGMRLCYCHPRPNPELDQQLGAQQMDLDSLLRMSDVVSLHIPMRSENRHLLDAERLELMRRGAILINTARGAVIDELALIEALKSGRLSAAGLDVYELEPELAPGLAELPNVVLLPHLGSATTATRQLMSKMVAENILAVLRGEQPEHPVN